MRGEATSANHGFPQSPRDGYWGTNRLCYLVELIEYIIVDIFSFFTRSKTGKLWGLGSGNIEESGSSCHNFVYVSL